MRPQNRITASYKRIANVSTLLYHETVYNRRPCTKTTHAGSARIGKTLDTSIKNEGFARPGPKSQKLSWGNEKHIRKPSLTASGALLGSFWAQEGGCGSMQESIFPPLLTILIRSPQFGHVGPTRGHPFCLTWVFLYIYICIYKLSQWATSCAHLLAWGTRARSHAHSHCDEKWSRQHHCKVCICYRYCQHTMRRQFCNESIEY